MSKLEEFITSLTDTELSIFIANQYDGLLGSSKQRLKDAVIKRNLSTDKLSELYQTGLTKPVDNTYHFCPRCYSTKLFIETDHEMRTVKYYSYEVAIDTLRCRLCGYNPVKSNCSTFSELIKHVFKRNNTVRIPKVDERVFKEL